ncbi:MAG TPA: K(+)-transporting ATPase subunit F [Prolixibacteraceae bacterium]|nr:K(+)-transporting ATPase subunit F [Prolixibacteraceae bacterium]
MNTSIFYCLAVPLLTSVVNPDRMANPPGYTIGALIAIALLAYLVYSLIKPEKF